MPSFKGDRSHYLFFERLRNFGLYDCLEKFHQSKIRTLRHAKTDYPWQNDYLFAGKALFDRCVSCDVVDDTALYEIKEEGDEREERRILTCGEKPLYPPV